MVRQSPRHGFRGRLLLTVLLGALLFLSPQVAWANTGTALMAASFFHLFIGNAILGVLEGWALAWIFKVSRRQAILIMIAANYLSMWVGMMFFGEQAMGLVDGDLNDAWMIVWSRIAIAYILTLVFEWPFIALALRSTEHWFKKSLIGTLATQTASYVLLFGLYWPASDRSVFHEMEVVPPGQIPLPASITVYYINAQDGDVYRRDLKTGEDEWAFQLNSENPHDTLCIRQNRTNPDLRDLVAATSTGNSYHLPFADVKLGIPSEIAPVWENPLKNSYGMAGFFETNERAPSIGITPKESWEVYSPYYSFGGFSVHDVKKDEWTPVGCETPVLNWRTSNVFCLPGNIVLFQLGHDQICALELETKRVALLWRGRGPVPFLE